MQRGDPARGLGAGPELLMRGSRTAGRRDAGFTLVEVLVAVLVLSVGILGVFGALVSANQLSSGAQVHDAAVSFAEQQLDNLRQELYAVTYTNFGMSGDPTADSSNANDPNYYVSTTSAGTPCLLAQGDSPAGWCEPFVTQPSTLCASSYCVPDTPQTISGYQGLTGTYDVYVTYHQELPSPGTGNGCVSGGGCLSGPDEERITVAVLPGTTLVNGVPQAIPGDTGSRKPVWLSTIVTNPSPIPAQ